VTGFALIPILLAAAAEPSGRVELSPSLREWKAEIEANGRLVFLARAYSADGQWSFPPDTEQRRAFLQIVARPDYARQLSSAHAMTANLPVGGRRVSFIVLNMSRAAEWQAFEDPILAHELGHVYLDVRGYRSPGLGPGTPVCETVHTGDLVQHVLIRREMTRRGIDYVAWMTATLAPVTELLQTTSPAGGSKCAQLARLSMWLDASLGLTTDDWPRLPEFLDVLNRSFPELAPIEAGLRDRLAAMDVSSRAGYHAALKLAAEAAAATSSR
jgi:hypothetical protein